MGQAPGYRAAPNGYPTANAAWQGTLLARQRFVRALLTEPNVSGIDVPQSAFDTLFMGVPSTGWVDHVNQEWMGGMLPANEVAALQQYVDATGSLSVDERRREAVVAAFSAPSFQYLY